MNSIKNVLAGNQKTAIASGIAMYRIRETYSNEQYKTADDILVSLGLQYVGTVSFQRDSPEVLKFDGISYRDLHSHNQEWFVSLNSGSGHHWQWSIWRLGEHLFACYEDFNNLYFFQIPKWEEMPAYERLTEKFSFKSRLKKFFKIK